MTTVIPIIRPGRVGLDSHKLRNLSERALISTGHLGSTVAVLGRSRGMDLIPRDEIDKLRAALNARRPLVVSETRARLYALALDCDVSDLEYHGPAERGRDHAA